MELKWKWEFKEPRDFNGRINRLERNHPFRGYGRGRKTALCCQRGTDSVSPLDKHDRVKLRQQMVCVHEKKPEGLLVHR